MTLANYIASVDYPVLFWTSVGKPAGDHAPLGYPDIDFAERNGFLDLEGGLYDGDCWRWNGYGEPTDDWRNTILQLTAFPNKKLWSEIVEDFEN